MSDLISRQQAIDSVNSETVSTNPEHFKSSEKFIKFMDDDDIASFGKWQWANGFNTAVVAAKIHLEKLPSAQPQRMKGRWIHDGYDNPHGVDWMHCSVCGRREPHVPAAMTNFCPNCGADMRGESDE